VEQLVYQRSFSSSFSSIPWVVLSYCLGGCVWTGEEMNNMALLNMRNSILALGFSPFVSA
jgi:hypothetical protein